MEGGGQVLAPPPAAHLNPAHMTSHHAHPNHGMSHHHLNHNNNHLQMANSSTDHAGSGSPDHSPSSTTSHLLPAATPSSGGGLLPPPATGHELSFDDFPPTSYTDPSLFHFASSHPAYTSALGTTGGKNVRKLIVIRHRKEVAL